MLRLGAGARYARLRVGHLVGLALSFPSVVFTVLLGVSFIYWAFVFVGAVSLDHADGAADGLIDGAAEAGAHGAAEAGAHGALDHGGLEHGGGDVDLDVDVADGNGGLAAMMASLKLRSAPVTVVFSSLVLFSWFFSMLAMEGAEGWFSGVGLTIARVAILVLSPILSLFPTSLVIRPLGRIFMPPAAAHHQQLVGKICTIRTGKVTDRFGEATLEDGGAGLVVRVRIDAGEELKRGDQAVIVGYDEERQEFTVAPMDDVLADSKRAGR
jgi:hypothetical protein